MNRDEDSDPVESALIWVCGSAFRIRIRIQGYKKRKNQEFNQQFFSFSHEKEQECTPDYTGNYIFNFKGTLRFRFRLEN